MGDGVAGISGLHGQVFCGIGYLGCVNVEVTPLPGIGVRKDFAMENGRRIGVVTHKDGQIELILSKSDDPDACIASLPLTTEEAGALANLLGAPQLVAQLNEDHREFAGIHTRQISIKTGSPFHGRTLGDTTLRTRTGVSVVAVMRAGQVQPSPTPEFTFTGGDVLVAVGTSDGLDEAIKILRHG
ncbi:potassium/proton antiporter regulatory subunit (CPA2 family) [Amycolatopsis cihanbeyliensis]|uniref:Potassium/proton antiporter regulatory subunit (CPA2 family) n=1 Tax=Amycolatopsis cihanbeyliensis TaxID=1128664 RepID=A0A542DEC6_AMYCI|nr:potassium/proton antiporter regulatory subunit (CPA2 family) [Amycolatopsis cihanbeyliensis]